MSIDVLLLHMETTSSSSTQSATHQLTLCRNYYHAALPIYTTRYFCFFFDTTYTHHCAWLLSFLRLLLVLHVLLFFHLCQTTSECLISPFHCPASFPKCSRLPRNILNFSEAKTSACIQASDWAYPTASSQPQSQH